jgi:AcrR family transcriptional regulator
MSAATTRARSGFAAGAEDAILDAAFEVFAERGLEGATTLEIARRARTSKRALYERFGSKERIFAALVERRAATMRAPLTLGEPTDVEHLRSGLAQFGGRFLEQLVKPTTLTMYRLVLACQGRGDALARHLDEFGRASVIEAVTTYLEAARRRGLIRVPPDRPARTFLALLNGDLVFRLVLGVAEAPTAGQVRRRARDAAQAVTALYGVPPLRGATRRVFGPSGRASLTVEVEVEDPLEAVRTPRARGRAPGAPRPPGGAPWRGPRP